MADLIIRIVGWQENFENNRTKELKSMSWVPIPNRMDGDGYTELLDHPNGAAHFGSWIALIEIASKCDVRGSLVRGKPQEGAATPQEGAALRPHVTAGGSQGPAQTLFGPHNSTSLARISRIPKPILDEAIKRLIEIGWIEYITIPQYLTTIPQEGAATPQEGASSRTRGPNGTERNGTEVSSSKNGHPTTTNLERVRTWLHDFVNHQPNPPVFAKKKPDLKIAEQVVEASNGATEDQLQAFLLRIHREGRKPSQSWAWFPAVIREEFRRPNAH